MKTEKKPSQVLVAVKLIGAVAVAVLSIMLIINAVSASS